MIIKAFSEFLKQFNDEIHTKELLNGWLKDKLSKKPENHVDNVIHEEIALLSDEECNIKFKGKSKTGKQLLESLYNFAESYEQQKIQPLGSQFKGKRL
ncbi:MAG: hypothetical protein MZV64_27050 [Ignavibacteriales bacterium]|nr:hypothetical protein [Ignavibacteriales bacterium]